MYLGGIDNATLNYDVPDFYINNLYKIERGNNVIQNPEDGVVRTTKWTGKVGLPYPSDYGYAADFTSCNTYVTNYSTAGCYDNDWLYKGETYHTITNNPNTTNGMGSGNLNYLVWNNGNVRSTWDIVTAAVYPTIYLDSSALAESGNGSLEHPYVLTS